MMKRDSIFRKSSIIFLLLLLAFVASPVYGQIMNAENINCEIEVVRSEYKAADQLTLKYTISNDSDRSINILKWNTPLEGINADIFTVLLNDEHVTYVGRTIKRGNPQPEDYITINPNEDISNEINLEEGYYMSESGDYSIELNTVILDLGYDSPDLLSAKEVFDSKSLSSNRITLKLTEDKNLPKLAMFPKEDASPKTPSYSGCSQSQKNILAEALDNAQINSLGAYLSLLLAPVDKRSNAERYKYWFGTYTATRYNTVSNNFDAIYKALTQQTITFHCDCDENYYAYVYPSQPYHIYLCNAFWSAPLTGTDSKLGTIIHEISHFYAVISTNDYVYGQTGAHNLALTDPSKAIDNADNHEYFAENTPPKDMPKAGLNLTYYTILFVGISVMAVLIIRRKRLQAR